MENEEILLIGWVILAYILGAISMYIFLKFNNYIERDEENGDIIVDNDNNN